MLLLDVDYTNNSRTLEPQGRPRGDEVVAEVDGVAAGLPAVVGRPRMMTAWRDGIRRVNAAPALLLGVWALTLLVSVPMAAAMRGMLAQHLGASLAADTAASGVNYDWMQEFSDQAAGLGVTFRPTILGFGAVLDNLSAFIDDTERPIVIVGAASVYIVLWIFVAGGIIDRYARDRATRTVGFFASSGVFFFRFLRLAAVQWIVYAAAVRIAPSAAVRSALSQPHSRRHGRAHRVRRAGRALRRVRRPGRGLRDGLRLREGAGDRRGSPQHARARPSRRSASSAATPPRPRRCSWRTSRCSRLWSDSTRSSRRAPAAPAPRCGSASRSASSTCSRGCG